MWKASLGDSHVAVKIFGPSSRSYYYNEVELYSLAYLQHPNIVGFLGCQEVLSVDGQAECRLILEYAPFGCLQVRRPIPFFDLIFFIWLLSFLSIFILIILFTRLFTRKWICA